MFQKSNAVVRINKSGKNNVTNTVKLGDKERFDKE